MPLPALAQPSARKRSADAASTSRLLSRGWRWRPANEARASANQCARLTTSGSPTRAAPPGRALRRLSPRGRGSSGREIHYHPFRSHRRHGHLFPAATAFLRAARTGKKKRSTDGKSPHNVRSALPLLTTVPLHFHFSWPEKRQERFF